MAVSPRYETSLVLGLVNFLGLIYFFEKVPNPLISTLSSKATASTIDSNIESIVDEICDLLRCGNSLVKADSISERL